MNYKKILSEFKKKTITKHELNSLFRAKSDEELSEIIKVLEGDNLIQPVKASGTNGNRLYPIYLKYRIFEEVNTDILREISLLHVLLQKNGYLIKHPEKYQKYHTEFEHLNRYLFANSDRSIAISRKERSFEIFREEKVLDIKEFTTILLHIGLDKNVLAFYDTPEYCFYDYIPYRKNNMKLLILENKDIWFNLRRMMSEMNSTKLFNTEIDGIIYGCGNSVTKADAFTQYSAFLGISETKYIYWGDIDRAGLNIYCSLLKANPSLEISLFVPAYEKMLELSQNTEIPYSCDKREQMADYTDIYIKFKGIYKELLLQSISENKRIPQEIINFAWLKENMR